MQRGEAVPSEVLKGMVRYHQPVRTSQSVQEQLSTTETESHVRRKMLKNDLT